MQQPIIEQIEKSNFARRATVELNGKLITLPSYGIFLQKATDWKAIEQYQLNQFAHLGYVAGPMYALKRVIEEREARKDIVNAFGEPVEKRYLELRKRIWFEDTACESLYYTYGDSLKEYSGFSKELRDFLASVNQENYHQKFLELKEDSKLYMRFLNEFIDEQTRLRMDFVMPPVPMISNASPKYMIEIWLDMVKTTAVLADTKVDKPGAIYLSIHANNFKKPEVLNLLMEKLYEETTREELSKIKFVVVKIIDVNTLETETAATRIRYKAFMTSLSTYCSNTASNLILLDCNSIGLASISLGADCFVEQLSGASGNGFRISKDKNGRYYHPEALKTYNRADISEIAKSTGSLPCNCKFCKVVGDVDRLDLTSWRMFRRAHLVAARHEEIKECHEAIQQDIITNAMTDKIQRSDVKNFLDLLPK
jgi:hypothetical protein